MCGYRRTSGIAIRLNDEDEIAQKRAFVHSAAKDRKVAQRDPWGTAQRISEDDIRFS
jgi:hypothetical protein